MLPLAAARGEGKEPAGASDGAFTAGGVAIAGIAPSADGAEGLRRGPSARHRTCGRAALNWFRLDEGRDTIGEAVGRNVVGIAINVSVVAIT